MVDRPDWGQGGEHRSLVPADPQIEIDQQIVASGALTPAEVADMRAGRAPAAAHDQPRGKDGRYVAKPASDPGLPAIVADEMRKSADGYDAQLGSMQHSAQLIVAEYGQSIVPHFETLSDPLKVKAYRALMQHPGASLPKLIDKIEPTLTLDEAAEADRWVRALAGMVRR